MELTILLPCLNEALTVERCVRSAHEYIRNARIHGEVVLADNGSTDGSQALAAALGARVVQVNRKGYGAALIGGIEAARGRFVVMADADNSYDLGDLDKFMEQMRLGAALVVGNRFKGGIKPGAMPLLNRYIGNPALSYIGRKLFPAPVGDFHCGMRGFDRQKILGLNLACPGMEFASEMVIKASLAKLPIAEVPITLQPDGRQRSPHLRPWRDGWRHLRFMLLRSPKSLFLYPGLVLVAIGLVGTICLMTSPVRVPGLFTLDINALLYFSIATTVGLQMIFFGLFAIAIARKMNLSIAEGLPRRLLLVASMDGTIAVGALIVVAGMFGALYAVLRWGHAAFGPLVPSEMMRTTIPSVTALAIGMQIVFGGLLLGFIEIE